MEKIFEIGVFVLAMSMIIFFIFAMGLAIWVNIRNK